MEEKKEQKKPSKNSIFARLKKIKHIEIYLALLAGAAALLIYFSTNPFGNKNSNTNLSSGYVSASDYCADTEARLTRLLSSIKGAGKVNVMISFESSTELVIAYITSSNNSGENTQGTSSPQILNQSGAQIPLILKEIYPKVTGAVIVAEGAGETKVKLDITNAACTLLNISPSNVNVFRMN